jgi:hypothetical protein
MCHYSQGDETQGDSRDRPLTCVQHLCVSLALSQVGRVAIHDGDTGHDLAAEFCRHYNLDDRTRDILGETLQQQIDALKF